MLVIAICIVPIPDLWAQRSIQVLPAGCEECVIERRIVMEIAGRDEPMVGPYAILAPDSRGRWLLATMDRSPGEVAVYDANGRFVERFGRKGEGPGELMGVFALVVSRGDTVHLFDNYLRRYSIFSPSYKYVRSAPYSGQVFSAAELSDGSLIVNADFARPNTVGYPLHRIDANGRPVRSFGVEVPGYRSDAGFMLSRVIATVIGDQVWAVPPLRYEPVLWSSAGKVLELQRMARWFPPQITTQSPGREKPPTPSVGGIWHDGHEQLWVILQVPDANWRAPPAAMLPQGERGPPVDWDREYDTIVEVINTRTGRLLASQRFGELLRRLMPGGHVAHYREDTDGEPFLAVWQLSLSIPPGR